MEKKKLIAFISLIVLLIFCIALMSISLLVDERSFRNVSGYIAIASVVITLVGVVIIMRSSHKHKND